MIARRSPLPVRALWSRTRRPSACQLRRAGAAGTCYGHSNALQHLIARCSLRRCRSCARGTGKGKDNMANTGHNPIGFPPSDGRPIYPLSDSMGLILPIGPCRALDTAVVPRRPSVPGLHALGCCHALPKSHEALTTRARSASPCSSSPVASRPGPAVVQLLPSRSRCSGRSHAAMRADALPPGAIRSSSRIIMASRPGPAVVQLLPSRPRCSVRSLAAMRLLNRLGLPIAAREGAASGRPGLAVAAKRGGPCGPPPQPLPPSRAVVS